MSGLLGPNGFKDLEDGDERESSEEEFSKSARVFLKWLEEKGRDGVFFREALEKASRLGMRSGEYTLLLKLSLVRNKGNYTFHSRFFKNNDHTK